jgi:hypothetical protein
MRATVQPPSDPDQCIAEEDLVGYKVVWNIVIYTGSI